MVGGEVRLARPIGGDLRMRVGACNGVQPSCNQARPSRNKLSNRYRGTIVYVGEG